MKIPIIFYHRLFHDINNHEKYSIDKIEFERHLHYLSENGFQTISLEDMFAPSQPNDSTKKIIISFDDGSDSDYSVAFPLLKKYGFVATFFITVSWIGTKGYVTWPNLKEMASCGMSIQSHGMTHAFLSDLNDDTMYSELNESKNMLAEKLNVSVDFISLPGGACSSRVIKMAEHANYKGVCTSKPGLEAYPAEDTGCTVLNRFLITRQTRFEDFGAIVLGAKQKVIFSNLKYHVTSNLRKMIGNRTYYMIWSKFFKNTG